MKKTFILLAFIVFFAATLRLYKLGDYPVGFHRDEAFLGYNAYSILKTGKDINGALLPLHFESFIYSPGGYAYFAIPSIKLFDLSVFSVRLPSAIFGSLTVLLTFFVAKELLNRKVKRNDRQNYAERIALLSSFLLAITPWHINLSRTTTENVIVLFFIMLGVLLFLMWERKEKWYFIILSFLSFGLTLLIYQAPRAFLPLFIPLLAIVFLKKHFSKRTFLVGGLFFLTILLPLVAILTSDKLSLRLKTVSIFATDESRLQIDQSLREDGVEGVSLFATRLFHNKIGEYTSQFLQNYFAHFSYNFLFTDDGFPDRYRIPHMGLLYSWELFFLALGIIALLKMDKKIGIVLIGWIFLVPIGSALAFDDIPNLQRTLVMLPPLCIVVAMGFYVFFSFFASQHVFVKRGVTLCFSMIVIYGLIYYMHQYYFHASRFKPWFRMDGYKELVAKVLENKNSYNKVVITNRESAPTIFFLFYGKYDPTRFQEETKNAELRDFDRIGFSSYEFSTEECPLKTENKDGLTVLTGEKKVLYVNSGLCPSIPNTVELATIRRGDDSLVFRILRLNE